MTVGLAFDYFANQKVDIAIVEVGLGGRLDSTNIITPLMPYFPLVVVFCQRYFKKTGIGTLVSIMIPYSIGLLVVWTLFLVLFWVAGIPLGI